MTAEPDRRLTPATDRVAHDSLRDVLDRPAYTPGKPARLIAPLADLCPAPHGPRERQINLGADVIVIDDRDGYSFVQAVADGYCGWVRSAALGPDPARITHRVRAPATHIYTEPDLKSRELAYLSIGARLAVSAVQNGFARLSQGGWVPLQHIADQPATDPAAVAETLLGTPYLWGGNSRAGIDCSGLAQAALTACAIPCPGDSDLQRAALADCDTIARGDLLFWPGHVAMALDSTRMIHANAFTMSVVIEPIATAISRIDAAGHGPFLGTKRIPAPVLTAFP